MADSTTGATDCPINCPVDKWEIFEGRAELKNYVEMVYALTKTTLGNPLDPKDDPMIWLPPPLNTPNYLLKLGQVQTFHYHVEKLLTLIAYHRCPPFLRITISDGQMSDDRVSFSDPYKSDYHIEHAMECLQDKRSRTYIEIIAVQHAMRAFFRIVREIEK